MMSRVNVYVKNALMIYSFDLDLFTQSQVLKLVIEFLLGIFRNFTISKCYFGLRIEL